MLLQGLTLTIVGMAVVFIFLTLLVFVMKLLSAFIPKYFPDKAVDKQSGDSRLNREFINNQRNAAEIAAVIAAVKSYSHS